MMIEDKEEFVEITTDEDMKKKLTEHLGNLTEEYWINISENENSSEDLFNFKVKPKKDKKVNEVKEMLERRLH